jgi:hypothetical protein
VADDEGQQVRPVRHATSRMRIAPLPYRRARIGGAQISAIETLPSRYSPTSGAREYSPTGGATRRRRFCDVASATKVGPAVTLVAPPPVRVIAMVRHFR